MSTIDYTAIPATKYTFPPTEKGETASVVWNLDELKEAKIPFEHLHENELECTVELEGAAPPSNAQIRFGLQKTQYKQLNGNNKLNYLSLCVTALCTGGREGIKFLVSLDNLNADLTVSNSPLKDAVVHLKSRGDQGRRVILKQLLYYSYYVDSYHRESSEIIHSNQCNLYGITVTLLNPAKDQPLQKVSCQDDWSFTKSLQSMYESEQSYSDIKLETKDGMILDAHKFILAARSPVFRDMLKNNTRDEEGTEGKLKIDNINGKPLRSILLWIYTNSLDESADKVISEVMEGAKVLQLTGLLALIDTKLITICHPKNMMQLFTAALEHGMETAVEDIRQYIKENIDDSSLKVSKTLRASPL